MRQLLVEGDKTFKLDIPDDAKVTYGPWAPPKSNKAGGSTWNNDEGHKRGTLRIYTADGKSILACFAGVTNFRDISEVKYSELVAKEESAAIWKSDDKGYEREDKMVRQQEWVTEPKLIPGKTTGKKKK